jgi:hypothetical protein
MGSTCGTIGEKRVSCRWGKLWDWYHLEDTGLDGPILLKWTMRWIFLAQDWDKKVINFGFCKCGELLTG